MNIRRLSRLFATAKTCAQTPLLLQRLHSKEADSRFLALSGRYGEYLRKLSRAQADTVQNSSLSWGDWSNNIAASFSGGVPLDFQRHPLIKHTMVFSGTPALRDRITNTLVTLGPDTAHQLLREDHIGMPFIADRHWLTSANRAHHASGIANYQRHCGNSFLGENGLEPTYVEWGGGYGDMARIIRHVNEQATYVIIDLPALSALQAVYLGSLESEASIHLITDPNDEIIAGKINLLSPTTALAMRSLKATHFVSTWALTESPRHYQQKVLETGFFGASHVLLGFALDENNALRDQLTSDFKRVPAGMLLRDGLPGNGYAFR